MRISLKPSVLSVVKLFPPAVFVLLAVCGLPKSLGAQAVGEPRSLDEVVVQLRWLHQFQFAGYYAAAEKGFYEAEGLKVKLVPGGYGIDTVEEVLAGRARYGVSNAEILLNRLKGEPVVVLAAIFQHSPLVMVTRGEAGINNPQQLAGKRVKMTRQSRDVELHAMLANEGVALDRIQLVEGSAVYEDYFDESLDAVSAYLTNELFYLRKAKTPFSLIRPPSYGIDFYGDCLFTSEEEIERHPRRAQAMREATLEGWRYAMAHPEEIIDLVATRYNTKKSREHLRFEAEAVRELIMPELVDIGHMNPGRWEHMANTFARFGWVESKGSLEGFLYDPDLSNDVSRLKKTAYTAIAISCLIALSATFLMVLNRRLKREIRQRNVAQKALVETEEALRNERDYLKNVFESSADAMGIVDARGRFIQLNRQAMELLGYSDEELKSMKVFDLYEDPRSLETMLEKLRREGTIRNHPIVLKRKDGARIALDLSLSLVKDQNGRNLGSVCVAHDLREIREAQAALKESEMKYRAIVEHTDAHIYMVAKDFSIKFVNSKWKERVGYDPMERGEKCYVAMAKRKTPCPDCKNDRVFAGESLKFEKHFPDGAIFEFYNAPIRHHDGTVSKMSVGHNVTEQRMLQRQLFHVQQMEAIGTLAGGIAHDFNNLLTAILGNVSCAQLPSRPVEKIRESLERATDACLRAKDLTQHLITFSKGGVPAKKVQRIGEIVKNGTFLALTGSSFECQLSISEDLWPIDCDAGQIHQVVNNLVINARESMSAEGGVISVEAANVVVSPGEIPSLSAGRYVKLSVRDTGIGMGEETASKIFHPYFSTKERGEQKGMGLGLTIVHSIVRKHGGHILVNSSPEEGTTFHLYFPASREPVALPPAKPSPHMGRGRVLLMDDEEVVREVASQMLEHLGYEIQLARDGREALEQYRRAKEDGAPFDAVLLDLTVRGGMGGKEAVKELLAMDPAARTIVMSGYSRDRAISHYEEFGFLSVIKKPFEMEDLGQVLHRVITG